MCRRQKTSPGGATETSSPTAHTSVTAARVNRAAHEVPEFRFAALRALFRRTLRVLDDKAHDTLIPLRLQEREQDHITDRFRTGQQHCQPVDPNANAAGRWHAVLEREQKFFVQLLRLLPGLLQQAPASTRLSSRLRLGT